MKKLIFILITFILLFLVLALFEGVLRLAGYGRDYPLFIQKGSTLVTNPDFARKYFSDADISIPELIEQKIPLKKGNGVPRIVALGGSTTAGFPYEVNINFPWFLKTRLQREWPGKKVEMINLGISAVNSFTVADMTDEVIALEPDAVLIYMGHNEFYGALGPASTQAIGSNRALIRLTLWLREWRLYQLLQNGLRLFSPAEQGKSKASLMSQMIGRAQLLPGDPLYRTTLDNFSANLSEILSTLKEAGIHVIISPLVSNLRDQYPLGHTPLMEEKENRERYEQARAAWQADSTAAALNRLSPLLKLKPVPAEAAWLAARIYDRLGQWPQAESYYRLARDNDPMPFRAPSAINRIIDSLAGRFGVPLTDTGERFRRQAREHIPGNDLFLEHLHPNQRGYALIARSFEQRLSFLKDAGATGTDTLSLKSYLAEQPFTLFDMRIGEMKVESLLEGFPFNGRTVFTGTPSTPLVDSLVRRHIYHKLFWDGAHFELGDYYKQNNRYDEALAEYEAVYYNDPTNPSALYRIGDIYLLKKEFDRAAEWYRRALEVTPGKAYLYAKLGRTLMIAEKTDEALKALETVIQLEKQKKTLKDDDRKTLYYLLGVGYARQGKYRRAEAAANMSLSIDRKFYPPFALKQKIKRLKKISGKK